MGTVRSDRVPPQNVDAERAVLGAMMFPVDNAEAIAVVMNLLVKDDFYKTAHVKIFDAIGDLFDTNKKVDLLTVTERLEKADDLEKVGGVPYLDEMIESVPTASNVKYYVEMVKEEAIRRRVIVCSRVAYDDGFDNTLEVDEVIGTLEKELRDLRNDRQQNGPRDSKSILKATFKTLSKIQDSSGLIGLSTGFPDLDQRIFGLQKAQYIIVAGRPSMGKSMFIQAIAQEVAINQGLGVMIFSLETTANALSMRMLSSVSDVELNSIRRGFMGQEHWAAITRAAGVISETKIYIDDRCGLTIREIRSAIYQIDAVSPIDLIVVDYMQLCKCREPGLNRTDQIEFVSGGLKEIAREFDVPLIAVSQLSRAPEGRPDSRPKLSDLRQSGAIEQDADLVILLYRPNYYDKTASDSETEVIIAKQRDGETGTIKLLYNPSMMQFKSLAKSLARSKVLELL